MLDIDVSHVVRAFLRSMRGVTQQVRLDGRGWVRLDAPAATAFIQQELEYLKSTTFDIKRVAQRARDFIPISHDAPPGAERIAWTQFDGWGEADIITDYSKDFPRVDVSSDRLSDKFFSLGASYGFSIQDLRVAALTGRRIDNERALRARKGMEIKLDEVAAIGSTKLGTKGFINNTNVNIWDGTAIEWSVATPGATIKRTLDAIISRIYLRSKGHYQGAVVLLPPKLFAIANAVTFSDVNSESVLALWFRSNPYVKRVDQWTRLEGAGVGGTDRIVVYADDPDVASLEISQEYEEFDPQPDHMEFKVPCHMRTAGTIIRQPMAMQYADGEFDVDTLA